MTFLHRWFEEVWNKGRESAIDEMVQPDVIAHGLSPDGAPVVGVGTFKTFFHTFRDALSEVHVHVEDTVTEGALAVARFSVTAKHTGDSLGVPPRETRFISPGCRWCGCRMEGSRRRGTISTSPRCINRWSSRLRSHR